MKAGRVGLVILAGAMLMPATRATEILGTPPGYTDKRVSDVPNAPAIGRRIWAPGLDEGFVPQGLTMAGGKLLLVSYRSREPSPQRGLCRVFQIDPASGALNGQFDLPADVGHAGGLAYGEGALFVAEGGLLLRVDLAASLAKGRAEITGRRTVTPGMGPSFLAYHDGALWFGVFAREVTSRAQLFSAPVARVFAVETDRPLRPADATSHGSLPLHTQGATIDAAGRLWLSVSRQHEGWLYRVERETGRVLDRHAMPPGIEDLAHTGDVLWSVGECGTKRWLDSPTFYPLLFEIRPALLAHGN